MKHGYLFVLVLLAACGLRPEASVQTPPHGALGLVEVTIDLRDEASPTATANFIPLSRVAAGGVKSQAITGLNHDIQLKRKSVSFSDFADTAPYTGPTRYISATFEIANRSGTTYNNMSFLATSFASGPFATKNGTTFTGMSYGTGATIPDNTALPSGINIYRGMLPTHAMRRGSAGSLGPIVDSLSADLQYFTPAESLKVAADLAVPFPGAQVLGYGFVARNFVGGRQILPVANTCDVNTDLSCFKGQVTLAFKVPRISPRQNNPFVFSMVFLVADESSAYISQSPEEQTAPTFAGLSAGSVGSFSQVRTLHGSTYAGANHLPLCIVRTAVSTPTFPNNLFLPDYVPTAPGSLDICFDTDGKQTTAFAGFDRATSMVIQPDGRIVVAGTGGGDFALARYHTNGSLDTSFGSGGKVTTDMSLIDEANAVAIQSNGKIVAAGQRWNSTEENFHFALVRYNADGSLDTAFGTGGIVSTAVSTVRDIAHAVAIQPDGKIVVAGEGNNGDGTDYALARYNTNGSLDTGFGSGGKVLTNINFFEKAYAIALQSDGKIVLAGINFTIADSYNFALLRYNQNGSLDTGFGTGGEVVTSFSPGSDGANAIAIQSNGQIVVAGGGNLDFALARYNPNGSLDPTFGTGGKVITPVGSGADIAGAMALQSDGKIVAAGYSFNGSNNDFALVRYNPDGSLDTTFGTGGKATTGIGTDDVAKAIVLQSDGKIVLAGESLVGNYDFALARYNP